MNRKTIYFIVLIVSLSISSIVGLIQAYNEIDITKRDNEVLEKQLEVSQKELEFLKNQHNLLETLNEQARYRQDLLELEKEKFNFEIDNLLIARDTIILELQQLQNKSDYEILKTEDIEKMRKITTENKILQTIMIAKADINQCKRDNFDKLDIQNVLDQAMNQVIYHKDVIRAQELVDSAMYDVSLCQPCRWGLPSPEYDNVKLNCMWPPGVLEGRIFYKMEQLVELSDIIDFLETNSWILNQNEE